MKNQEIKKLTVDELKNKVNTEIFLSNDANCAAVGEMMYGNAKDYKDYLFIKYLKILQNTLIIKKREERASFLNILSRRT